MELLRALAVLAEEPGAEQARIARELDLDPVPDASAHTELFVLGLPPYASIYLGPEGMLGGEARDRVAGFLRALGIDPPADPDHLALLLGLAARLGDGEAAAAGGSDPARLRHAFRALLWEHLLPWIPMYLDAVQRVGVPPYPAWAALLERLMAEQARRLEPLPGTLPLHLRAAPPLPDPREDGSGDFLTALLAPARTGFILSRTDLAGAARDLGLGLRLGERRFVLGALLGQDAAAVLAWLGASAGQAARRWERLAWTGSIGGFWAQRATRTAELLTTLAAEARQTGASSASPAPGTSPGRQKSSISTT